MAEEQWERWDCDSSSWETHDDMPSTNKTDEEIHEPELQLPLVRVRNLSAKIEEEEKMNDLRHMFAASMFSSCTDLDTLSIDSDRTVRMCNRKEKDDEVTISDDVVDTKEKEKQSNRTQNDNIDGDRSIPNKHNIENKFKFPTSGPVESRFHIRKRTRRVSCPGAPIRRDLVLTEGGRARAA